MKVPQNYTTGATKKVDPLKAAIDGNFAGNQSAVSEQGSATSTVTETQSQILNASSSAATQIATQQSVSVQSQAETSTAGTSETETAKTTTRREVKEKFLVSMSKGERSVFKSFCALKGVSMNHFVMCAMDYFKEDLENGKVSISSHSYKRKES